tara:strand:- start:1309 stop:2664 length:1356 start_codon:yes stop_codon:yes gene_type:complete
MKIEKQIKKGLSTTLSIFVGKKDIEKKLEVKLEDLKSKVSLKGFRPGKVPPSVIKKQFGKAIYGEVIDDLLRETSQKAIKEKQIKIAGQPKIDLKSFGEGKDLSFQLYVESIPEIKLKPLKDFKATEYSIKINEKLIDKKLTEISKNHKSFKDKSINENAKIGDQIIFDYSATIDKKKFEGSEGKGIQIELGKDLFLKGFDEQLVGSKSNQVKKIFSTLPSNHPNKELANKKTLFECKIIKIKKPSETIINDEFAKQMGAKDLTDLKKLISDQISSQYKQALLSITKKEILDQIEKTHNFDLPDNLVQNEISAISSNLKDEDKVKFKKQNEKIAKSRIKLGLVLNELGEKNNLKVEEIEIKNEIQKQVKGMPGQEKLIYDYYQKNPMATQSIRGALYEEKIINFIKSKITLMKKELNTQDADRMISKLNDSKEPEANIVNKAKNKTSKSKK